VRTTLLERGLFQGARRVLVACSGGPDSQALLHVLAALQREHGCVLMAAAVDHGLRPEAARELAGAERLARALGLPFHGLRVEVPPGASLQAQARAARYAALLACAHAHGAECVAVGHTLDDQAETVLARLLRGTGLEGLAAIEPRRADGVVRPLIDAPRALVHAYGAELALEAAHDPSNDDPRFLRVRIRHGLLPALARENPRLTQALANLADDAREAASALTQQAEELLSQARSGVHILREAPGPLRRRALRRWVERELGALARDSGREPQAEARGSAGEPPKVALQRRHIVALERMLWVGGEVRLPGSVVAILDASGKKITFAPVSKRGRGG
jgi:tRNA(Ile)-lysidine synthase